MDTITLLRALGVACWTDEDTGTLRDIAAEIDAKNNWRLKRLLHQLHGEKRCAEMARHPDTVPTEL